MLDGFDLLHVATKDSENLNSLLTVQIVSGNKGDESGADSLTKDFAVSFDSLTTPTSHIGVLKFPSTSLNSPNISPLQKLRIGSCAADDFEIGRILGTGSFGRVCLARHKATDSVVAIKSLLKARIIKNEQVAHVRSERDVLLTLGHPFIVKMHSTFQDAHCIHFVMEYVPGGEFFSHLRSRGQLAEEVARFYAAQVLLVFEYLHSQDIVYRDLKVCC